MDTNSTQLLRRTFVSVKNFFNLLKGFFQLSTLPTVGRGGPVNAVFLDRLAAASVRDFNRFTLKSDMFKMGARQKKDDCPFIT
jgi:hypothetical protein